MKTTSKMQMASKWGQVQNVDNLKNKEDLKKRMTYEMKLPPKT